MPPPAICEWCREVITPKIDRAGLTWVHRDTGSVFCPAPTATPAFGINQLEVDKLNRGLS